MYLKSHSSNQFLNLRSLVTTQNLIGERISVYNVIAKIVEHGIQSAMLWNQRCHICYHSK